MKFDTEDLLENVLAVMTTGDALNLKIAAIEVEKAAKGQGLAPEQKQIPTNGYYQQTWSDKILNTSPAIFYGIEDVQSVDGGGALAKIYKIFIEVVYVDNGMTNDVHKRIARYSRALEELFQENKMPKVPYSEIKIDSVRPISFKLELDSDEEIKVGGITLTIALF